MSKLAEDLLAIVLRQIPWIVYAGVYRFRVVKHTSGRLDVEPVNRITGLVLAPIPLREVWCGVPGVRVQPAIGSEVLLAFVDRDPGQPVIVGFCPLSASKPVHTEIDASGTVDIGGGTKTIHREGDLADGGTFAAPVPGPLTYIGGDGKTWKLEGAVSGGVVNFTVTPITSASPGKIVAKADPSNSRGRA